MGVKVSLEQGFQVLILTVLSRFERKKKVEVLFRGLEKLKGCVSVLGTNKLHLTAAATAADLLLKEEVKAARQGEKRRGGGTENSWTQERNFFPFSPFCALSADCV